MTAVPKGRLCRLEDLPDPGSRGFELREGDALFRAFVVRQGPAVVGYVDRCPHAGWPLALEPDRFLTRDGSMILCSGHGALFRIHDGVCLAGPCEGRALSPWPVSVSDGWVVAP